MYAFICNNGYLTDDTVQHGVYTKIANKAKVFKSATAAQKFYDHYKHNTKLTKHVHNYN